MRFPIFEKSQKVAFYIFVSSTFSLVELVSSILGNFLQKVENLLKRKGYKNIYLETYSKAYAVNFYKKNGYKISKETVFMTKDL